MKEKGSGKSQVWYGPAGQFTGRFPGYKKTQGCCGHRTQGCTTVQAEGGVGKISFIKNIQDHKQDKDFM